jgi:hypothetical protein
MWLAVVSDPADKLVPIEVEVGLPDSGIANPVLVDVRTGQITPVTWVNREKQTLRVPLKDSVVAVTDSSYMDWPQVPAAPGELVAAISGHDIQLKWNKYGTAAAFEVQRSLDWGPWEKVATLPATETTYVQPAARAAHISCRVRAVGSESSSPWSNPAWVENTK